MPLFWCDPVYLFVMGVVGVVLFAALRVLLRTMQRRRLSGTQVGRWKLKLGMAVWLSVTTLYAVELSFAAFVEFTDAFSATNVSDRWFARYIEPFRNKDGFRDRREFVKGEHPDSTDVYFFGDSFTIGQGIESMDDLFVVRSEKRINARATSGQKQVRTFNAAEFGWEVSIVQGMLRGFLQKQVRPDIVVYVFMLNDIEGYDPRTEELIQQVQREEPQLWLWSRTYFFNWLYFRWQQSRASRTVDYFPHLADSYRGDAWNGVTGKLTQMKADCEATGVELRIVAFPFLHNLGSDYEFLHAHQQLADFCETSNIRFLDLEPVLTPLADQELTVNRFDNHPNEFCHRVVAEAIADQLLSDLPVSEAAGTAPTDK
ncbi:MAG: SGNH/GDSL hydrolase family protein [Planctomycetaceae bacterium]|nr:SGNH/GDSL hydrolase family protein [Planctomycetaceae bacterium]